VLDYLAIKEFPSDIAPIARGAMEVVSWWRNGELRVREREAALVGLNAMAYAAGVGADWLAPPMVGTASEEAAFAAALELEGCAKELLPNAEANCAVHAVNPLLVLQIAQLVMQLIKSLKK
jgi:hypothetical protein